MTGRVVISSCSLAKVTPEPENETQPTSTRERAGRGGDGARAARAPDSSSAATSAAAPPPTPLNSATSCGIWVIATRRAAGTPIAEPTPIASRIGGDVVEVLGEERRPRTRAPRRRRRSGCRAARWPGDESPFSARMKQTAATR